MKNFHILLTILMALVITACSSTKKVQTISRPQEDSLPALPLTEIDIPIKIYAPPILEKAEQIVSKEFTSEAWPNYVQPSCDFRYKYRFLRSGMSVNCSNNTIGVQFTGSYQVAGGRCYCSMGQSISPWISGSCGFGKEPMRKVALNIKSQLQFLPAYQVKTSTGLAEMMAYDKCQVSLFSNDVTDQILDSIKSSVNSYCAAFDSTVAGLSLTAILQTLKERTCNKINLGRFGFLQLNPKAIRVGQLNYAKDTFYISAGISCRPELGSDSINAAHPAAFPSLQEGPNRNNLSLYLNIAYDYSFLSRILNDTLYNKVFEIKGRNIVIKKVKVSGLADHQIEMQMDFAGSNKGSIFLRGKPVLDTTRQALTLEDISYSLESQDLALKVAKTLFKNKIKKTIQGKSYLDIAALVKSNMIEINTQLTRDLTTNISTTGVTHDARVVGILPREDMLLMQVYVQGEIAVIVKSLP